MYLKSGFNPEISAFVPAMEYCAVADKYQLNDSLIGDTLYFAVPSAYNHAPEHYFSIPASSIELGRLISVHISRFVSPYSINTAFPSVMDLFVTVTSRISKVLSRVFCYVGKKYAVRRNKKKCFTVCRPCVLRL